MPPPSSSSDPLEKLRQYTALAAQTPDDPDILARLDEHLTLAAPADRLELETLAARLVTAPEIAVRLLNRCLELTGGRDADLIARLGFVSFSGGDDARATHYLETLRALEGDTVRVLHLEATLTPDDARRKKLYTKILMMEPNNRTAWEHLLALRR